MSEYCIHIKILNPEKLAAYIHIIRKYNGSSIGEIKKRILTGYAVSFDWYKRPDIVESLAGKKNPQGQFRELVDALMGVGAKLEFYEEFGGRVSPITLRIIDNKIKRDKIITRQIQVEVDEKETRASAVLHDFISSAKHLISKDGLKAIRDYSQYAENEKAFEALLIELMRSRQHPENFDFAEWKELALHYQLNHDTAFSGGDFWEKFEDWGASVL